MGSSSGGVLRGFAHAARITTEGNKVLQQTNGHNHPVDGVEANDHTLMKHICNLIIRLGIYSHR